MIYFRSILQVQLGFHNDRIACKRRKYGTHGQIFLKSGRYLQTGQTKCTQKHFLTFLIYLCFIELRKNNFGEVASTYMYISYLYFQFRDMRSSFSLLNFMLNNRKKVSHL